MQSINRRINGYLLRPMRLASRIYGLSVGRIRRYPILRIRHRGAPLLTDMAEEDTADHWWTPNTIISDEPLAVSEDRGVITASETKGIRILYITTIFWLAGCWIGRGYLFPALGSLVGRPWESGMEPGGEQMIALISVFISFIGLFFLYASIRCTLDPNYAREFKMQHHNAPKDYPRN